MKLLRNWVEQSFFSSTSFCFTFAVWQTQGVNLSWKFDNSSFHFLRLLAFFNSTRLMHAWSFLLWRKEKKRRKEAPSTAIHGDDVHQTMKRCERIWLSGLHRSFDGAIPHAHEKMKKFNNFFCVYAVLLFCSHSVAPHVASGSFSVFPLCRVLPLKHTAMVNETMKRTQESDSSTCSSSSSYTKSHTCEHERINLSLTESKFIITK